MHRGCTEQWDDLRVVQGRVGEHETISRVSEQHEI